MDAYSNFAFGRILTAPSPPTTGTSLTMVTGNASHLPIVPFNASVWPTTDYPDASNAEIVRVTAIAGDVLTIARGQENTTPRAIAVGDVLAATITKKLLDDLRNASNINTGLLDDARLSPNLARRDQLNTFSQTATFQNRVWIESGPENAARLLLQDTTQPADQRVIQVCNFNQSFYVNSLNDALTVPGPPTTMDRSGNWVFPGTLTEQGRAVPMGHVIDVPYSQSLFTASGGATFTVPQASYISYWYTLIGKTCNIGVVLADFTISGTPNVQGWLMIAFPSGLNVARPASARAGVVVPGAYPVRVLVDIPYQALILQRDDGQAWATGAGQYLYCNITFPIT
jgi:hypothetical protein